MIILSLQNFIIFFSSKISQKINTTGCASYLTTLQQYFIYILVGILIATTVLSVNILVLLESHKNLIFFKFIDYHDCFNTFINKFC
jgi:cellulose synthase/poly-beta-1,6-N-acetylglucosamine synthase-like glycosyltransferase